MTPKLVNIFSIIGLALAAGALIGIGLYALFGKPTSREGKKRQQHVVNGFTLVGGLFLGMILMGSLVVGSQIALGIFPSTRQSKFPALLVALGALALIFLLIGYWAKHFAGWIGYSVLNGLLMISRGHHVNNPNIAVPRWWSISMTVSAFFSALVCLRFTKDYRLNGADKAALMCWVLAFTFAVDVDSTHIAYHQQLGLVAIWIACLALVAAWFYDRLSTRSARYHRNRTPPVVQHIGS